MTDTRLEIACGEAPYLVSRYDAATGEYIKVGARIGLLDRKLRIVGENVETRLDWANWAIIACMHTYGYEWQGDSLLLARQAVFDTIMEHYEAKFHEPAGRIFRGRVADIISWNIWQMDGLKGVVPGTDEYCLIKNWDNGSVGRFIDLVED